MRPNTPRASGRRTVNLADPPRDFDALLHIALSVYLRYVSFAVAEHDLRRFQTEQLADFRRRRMAQLVRTQRYFL